MSAVTIPDRRAGQVQDDVSRFALSTQTARLQLYGQDISTGEGHTHLYRSEPYRKHAFICACFHYMLGLVSESEVKKRTGKFQAFGECLHDVALVCHKVHTDFMEIGREKTDLS